MVPQNASNALPLPCPGLPPGAKLVTCQRQGDLPQQSVQSMPSGAQSVMGQGRGDLLQAGAQTDKDDDDDHHSSEDSEDKRLKQQLKERKLKRRRLASQQQQEQASPDDVRADSETGMQQQSQQYEQKLKTCSVWSSCRSRSRESQPAWHRRACQQLLCLLYRGQEMRALPIRQNK